MPTSSVYRRKWRRRKRMRRWGRRREEEEEERICMSQIIPWSNLIYSNTARLTLICFYIWHHQLQPSTFPQHRQHLFTIPHIRNIKLLSFSLPHLSPSTSQHVVSWKWTFTLSKLKFLTSVPWYCLLCLVHNLNK